MHKFFSVMGILRSPDDNETPNVADPEAKTDLDILEEGIVPEEDDDKEVVEEEETVEDEEDEDKDKEDKEEDKEEEEKEEEQLTRVSYTDVKAKYPTLFKDFPELKTAFFREQKFTELFPTVEAAQEASEAQISYENLRDVVLDGNAETLLNQIKEVDKDSLDKFTTNFLPSLMKVDRDSYFRITTPIVQGVFFELSQEGKKIGGKDGENLINAAKVANHAIFGNYDLGKPELPKEVKEDPKLVKDREAFYSKKYEELQTSISDTITKAVDADIEKGLDPTNSLQPGLKKLLIKDIKQELLKQLDADKAHMQRMNSLWSREKRNGFSGTLKDSIISTFLSRAKSLIPVVRKAKREEVFKKEKTSAVKVRDKITQHNNIVPPGRTNGSKSKVITVSEARKNKMSDLDILNS